MKRLVLAVLLLAVVGVGGCGDDEPAPSEVVGAYELDREATYAVQSELAGKWDQESGRPLRDMAAMTLRGENVVELTVSADGT